MSRIHTSTVAPRPSRTLLIAAAIFAPGFAMAIGWGHTISGDQALAGPQLEQVAALPAARTQLAEVAPPTDRTEFNSDAVESAAVLPGALAVEPAAPLRYPLFGTTLSIDGLPLESCEIAGLDAAQVKQLHDDLMAQWSKLSTELSRSAAASAERLVGRKEAIQLLADGAAAYLLPMGGPASNRRYLPVVAQVDPRAMELRWIGFQLVQSPGMEAFIEKQARSSAVESAKRRPDLDPNGLRITMVGDGSRYEVHDHNGAILYVFALPVPGNA